MLYIFFVERCIWRLICCLDLCWVACLVAFISLCFSFLWKTAFYQARQLFDRSLTDSYLSRPLDFFSRLILSQLRSIELFRICLDNFLIDSQSIEKVSIWSIAFRQLFDPLRCFCRRQILNSNVVTICHLSASSLWTSWTNDKQKSHV